MRQPHAPERHTARPAGRCSRVPSVAVLRRHGRVHARKRAVQVAQHLLPLRRDAPHAQQRYARQPPARQMVDGVVRGRARRGSGRLRAEQREARWRVRARVTGIKSRVAADTEESKRRQRHEPSVRQRPHSHPRLPTLRSRDRGGRRTSTWKMRTANADLSVPTPEPPCSMTARCGLAAAGRAAATRGAGAGVRQLPRSLPAAAPLGGAAARRERCHAPSGPPRPGGGANARLLARRGAPLAPRQGRVPLSGRERWRGGARWRCTVCAQVVVSMHPTGPTCSYDGF